MSDSNAIDVLIQNLGKLEIKKTQENSSSFEETNGYEMDEEELDEKKNKTCALTVPMLSQRSHAIHKVTEKSTKNQLQQRQTVKYVLFEALKCAEASRKEIRGELTRRGINKSTTEFYSYLRKFRHKIPQFGSVKEAFSAVIPSSHATVFREILYIFLQKTQKRIQNSINEQ